MSLFDADDVVETLTVGQLTRHIGETLARRFRSELWVQGQIRNLARSARGHVYFDLIDPVEAGAQPRAAVAVVLFDSSRQVVNRILTRAGNAVRMEDGVEVRVRGSIDFYGARGQVQLNMASIDPEFTLGRLGADRERLLEALQAEDLIDANAQRPLALVPLRVALVTSPASAAEADFVRQLAASGYAFDVTTHSTRVQGEFAPAEVAAAISAGAAEADVDVIAVVRGGGSRTDLAAFDTEPVARAIAASPVPVICGIGHEIDSSVADLVAHTSAKTPTACAQFLIDRLAEFDRTLQDRARRLVDVAGLVPAAAAACVDKRAGRIQAATEIRLRSATTRADDVSTMVARHTDGALRRADELLVAAAGELRTRAQVCLTSARAHSDRVQDRLVEAPRRIAAAHRHRLDLASARVDAVDPIHALARGFTITMTAHGQVVRSVDALDTDDEILTRFADGSVTSRVIDSTTRSNTIPEEP